jgi:hypothetical protein
MNTKQYKAIKAIKAISIVILLISASPATNLFASQAPSPGTWADFAGVNTNVASYDKKYLGTLSHAFKWIREYHNWAHYEPQNNSYKWDSITTAPHSYTWPDHNRFINQADSLGVQVLLNFLGKPNWVTHSRNPIDNGDGTQASHYKERLEFIGQAVARYGSVSVDPSLLQTTDKRTGLNLIKYYEDENEPDYWWASPTWPAPNYAAYLNAAHDGYGVSPTTEHPLLGIKSVDPNAIHVLGGLAAPDTIYLQSILQATPNGRIPFDILNFHMYSTDHTNGYSPEHEEYGFEQAFSQLLAWRDTHLPTIPIWITEFGWDTFINAQGAHSYTYANELSQANYLVRALLQFMHLGIQKAFVFMASDTDSQGLLQYSSSGFISDEASGHRKKPSWYFLTSMQNWLGNYKYNTTIAWRKPGTSNTQVYHLRLAKAGHPESIAHVLWCRTPNSNQDNGTQCPYELALAQEQVIQARQLNPADTAGTTIPYTEPLPAQNQISLTLSETPIVVFTHSEGETSILPGTPHPSTQKASPPHPHNHPPELWDAKGRVIP